VKPKSIAYYLSESSLSHDEIRAALQAALNPRAAGAAYTPERCWPREIYDDYVIYHDESETPPALYKRSYVIADDGTVTLGEPQKVKVETNYVPVTEAVLLESADDDGWNWRVQVIRAGTSLNGNIYPLSVLQEAAPLYSGVPVFYGKGKDHNPNERGFDSIAGYIVNAAPNADGVEATLEINRGKPDVRESFRHAWQVQERTGRTPFGLSHVIPHGGALLEAVKPRGYRVKAIKKVASVDVVIDPAAGGGVLAPVAESAHTQPFVPDALQEAIVNVETLLAKLRAGTKLGVDELAFLQEALSTTDFAAALAEAGRTQAQSDPSPDPQSAVTVAPDTTLLESRIAEMEQRTRLAESRALLTAALAESRLPEKVRTAIATDFDGRIFEAAELTARIERDRDIAASLAHQRPTGLGATPITEDQREKHQKAMDGLVWGRAVDGVRPFLTLKEAYQAITGDTRFSYIDGNLPRAILAEAIAWAPADNPLMQESIVSSTFGEVLGDSITRRMLQEYGRPDRNTWRAISNIVPVTDFRMQRRPRWGGYGFLPVVNEGGTYQPLTSPIDEEATDRLDKRGGLEDLTLEAIANDDMGVVRRIPTKLGYAAIDTLYKAVWLDTVKDNAVYSADSTALYHASHSNTGTTALGESGLLAVETAMRSQVAFNDQTALPLGEANMPRILVIPTALRLMAHKLVMGPNAVVSAENATTPNMFQDKYQVIVVDAFSDPTDWFAFADPSLTPTLEVGFYQGREEPELFVQDAQNVGSMFTADKVTYKIRHIWYVMIVDYRGTYRMVVAG
jgi:hypothetical protein